MEAWLWGVCAGAIALLLLTAGTRVVVALVVRAQRRRLADDAACFLSDREAWERRHGSAGIPWFHVRCAQEGFSVDAAPPGKTAWQAAVAWRDVEKVLVSQSAVHTDEDEVLVFARGQGGAVAVPLAADGAMSLLDGLVSRGLLDQGRLTDLLLSGGPAVVCGPTGEPPRGAGQRSRR